MAYHAIFLITFSKKIEKKCNFILCGKNLLQAMCRKLDFLYYSNGLFFRIKITSVQKVDNNKRFISVKTNGSKKVFCPDDISLYFHLIVQLNFYSS